MLERLRIQNYKCLQDVSVDLGEFTILIGPNDSGKSSFLEVVRALGNIVEGKDPFGDDRPIASLIWRKDASLPIVMEALGRAGEHQFLYRLGLLANEQTSEESLEWDGNVRFETKTSPEGPVIEFSTDAGTKTQPALGNRFLQQYLRWIPSPLAFKDALKSSLYEFDPKKLSTSSIPEPDKLLGTTGDNLAAVLDILQNSPDRSGFEGLQQSLHEMIPSLRGIVLPPDSKKSGAKTLEFILSGNGKAPVTIPASLASSGALLLTAFLTLAHMQSARLLLFEEPENGLHPSRLHTVLEILRKISRGEVGNRKRQVILTTHNPLLLNFAKPEEVRVFVRHLEEGTRVIPMTQAPDINRLLNEFALGELWYLLGEEKLIEGQPA